MQYSGLRQHLSKEWGQSPPSRSSSNDSETGREAVVWDKADCTVDCLGAGEQR